MQSLDLGPTDEVVAIKNRGDRVVIVIRRRDGVHEMVTFTQSEAEAAPPRVTLFPTKAR